MPKNMTLFIRKIRVYRQQGNFYIEFLYCKEKKMQHQQEENAGKDLFLLLFVGVALWLLIFQSGLFN